MKCKHCSHVLDEQDNFCSVCGTPVEKDTSENAAPAEDPVAAHVKQTAQKAVEEVKSLTGLRLMLLDAILLVLDIILLFCLTFKATAAGVTIQFSIFNLQIIRAFAIIGLIAMAAALILCIYTWISKKEKLAVFTSGLAVVSSFLTLFMLIAGRLMLYGLISDELHLSGLVDLFGLSTGFTGIGILEAVLLFLTVVISAVMFYLYVKQEKDIESAVEHIIPAAKRTQVAPSREKAAAANEQAKAEEIEKQTPDIPAVPEENEASEETASETTDFENTEPENTEDDKETVEELLAQEIDESIPAAEEGWMEESSNEDAEPEEEIFAEETEEETAETEPELEREGSADTAAIIEEMPEGTEETVLEEIPAEETNSEDNAEEENGGGEDFEEILLEEDPEEEAVLEEIPEDESAEEAILEETEPEDILEDEPELEEEILAEEFVESTNSGTASAKQPETEENVDDEQEDKAKLPKLPDLPKINH
jgi:hypothetical protein